MPWGQLYQLQRQKASAYALGSWTIPGDENKRIAAAVISLVHRDNTASFCDNVYATTLRVAKKEQRACLNAEVKRQNIKTKEPN